MKASIVLLLIGLAVAQAQFQWLSDSAAFVRDATLGSYDMARAYKDMRESNYRKSDLYFHARGNYDAAQRGPGGAWSSKVISNGRETYKDIKEIFTRNDRGSEERRNDQEANNWGRSGGDPNRYRPKGLPNKY